MMGQTVVSQNLALYQKGEIWPDFEMKYLLKRPVIRTMARMQHRNDVSKPRSVLISILLQMVC